MTYKQLLQTVSYGDRCRRESWTHDAFIQFKILFDGNGVPVDDAMVEMTEAEYIGIYTPEPRDEFANDWVIVE